MFGFLPPESEARHFLRMIDNELDRPADLYLDFTPASTNVVAAPASQIRKSTNASVGRKNRSKSAPRPARGCPKSEHLLI